MSRRNLAGLLASCGLAIAALAAPASAVEVTFPIDSSQSSIAATLTLLAGSSTDTSTISGFVVLDINDPLNPTEVSVVDFQINVDEQINFAISYGLLGSATATGTNAAVAYAGFTPSTPVPVDSFGDFVATGITALTSGNVNYNVSGLICVTLQSQGVLCSASFNLADFGAQNVESFEGNLAVAGNIVTLTSAIDVTVPLDGGSGDVRVVANLVGSAEIEVDEPDCVADFNNSGSVTVDDIFAFLSAWFAGDPAADVDQSSSITVDDIFFFLSAWFAGCPD